MKKVVTSKEMASLDAYTIHDVGIPSMVLMERAALAVAAQIQKISADRERILVVCGNGNNGGDGVAVARLLYLKGYHVDLFLTGNSQKYSAQMAQQILIARHYHVPEVNNPTWHEYTTIVDAVFGVGLTRPVEGRYKEIIQRMNETDAKKVAVDIPSGLDGSTGRVLGTAFCADLTVTFAFMKQGMCFYPGRSLSGKVVVADIGIYDYPGNYGRPVWQLEREDMKQLPQRVPWGNKGTFGKVLLVAGSKGMCGAAYFAACAALNTGAGMVKVQTVEENRIPLQSLLPEAMVESVFSEEINQQLLSWCDVLVIGPGLGCQDESRERANWFLAHGNQAGKPVILDADGLNLLSMNPGWKQYLKGNTVLTPHMGEMGRLTGLSISELKEDPVGAASDYAKETGAVCVLKDAGTVTAGCRDEIYINMSGNAGMAAAGSGDVLSGMLAGVFCMYLNNIKVPDPARMAALGVFLHGLCGDRAADAAGTRGMNARNILDAIPLVLRDFETGNREEHYGKIQ